MPTKTLNQKIAIVTGAAQGMGRAIAEILAQQGAQVVVNDVNEQARVTAEQINGVYIKADVTKPQEVRRMVDQTIDQFGRIDILVNNAGILRTSRIFEITREEWDLVLDVNLNGVFNCTMAVLPDMKAQHYGRIVNISSSAGRSVSTLGGAHYTTSKAAVLGFTRAVAKEVGGLGITVNAVCPGLIDTEMVQQECAAERIKSFEDAFPIHRLGTPEEVAKLVLYLVADADYTTGAAIDINGGDLMI